MPSHATARLLTALSILLLGGAIAWFLHKTYQDEKEALAREAGFLFVSVVREVEAEALRRIVLRFPTAAPIHKMDTMMMMSFLQADTVQLDKVKGQRVVEFKVERKVSVAAEHPIDETSGLLSRYIALGPDSLPGGLADTSMGSSQALWTRLDADFGQAIAKAGLTVQYLVQTADSGAVLAPGLLRSGAYTDLASGLQYTAALRGYEGHLLWRMRVQILFSGLLFACVAAAFVFFLHTLRAQRRLAEAKDRFIQNISHELKTPVATVGVALEALQGFDALANPARAAEYIGISQRELGRLSLLMDKALGIVTLDGPGAAALSLSVFDVSALLAQVVADYRPRVEQAGAEVSVAVSGTDFTVRADRLHLSGVLFNLLDNALKYGGTPPQIAVSLRREGQHLHCSVADNGPGIPEAHRERVFEAFFRVPSAAGHQVKGHGLGLSYAAKVAQAHGGQLTLGHARQGAVFILKLPIHHA